MHKLRILTGYRPTGPRHIATWSGHGNLDLSAYEKYLRGELEGYEYPANAVEEAMAQPPRVALPV